MSSRPLSIFLLVRSLEVGGAQRQLIELAKALREGGHRVAVGVFYGGGALEPELESAGVEVVDLAKRGRWDLLAFTMRLVQELNRRRPQVIYSFLSNPNTIALAASPFIGSAKIVWSVRSSKMNLTHYGLASRLSYWLECRLSRWADAIIANSSAGVNFAVANGFPKEKMVVVPNGIDIDRFRPDARLRARQRQKFGLSDDEIAIGVLARLDPIKGHSVFLEAVPAISAKFPNVRFFCIGAGPELPKLERMTKDLGIEAFVTFAGEQDGKAALNALDIACSCSIGEGFPNSVAEAMACGLPCVVTDAGDSAAIVGDLGTVVPIGSPEALASALDAQIRALSSHDAGAVRARIVARFSINAMLDRTLEVFRQVLALERRHGSLVK